MSSAPLPADEAARLAALRRLGILDSPPDAEFDALVRAASLACGVPIAALTLVDEARVWLKANVGLAGVTEGSREDSFCAHTILEPDLLEVPDAAEDARFSANPAVTGEFGMRFYAAAPIRLGDGSRVGALCVVDRQARLLNEAQRGILRCLAEAAASALESWRVRRVAERASSELLASEERLRRSYEATPAMLHCLDVERRLLTVSDTWLDRLGYARHEVIGRPSSDFLSRHSRERADAVVWPALLATGRADAIEYEMVCSSGELIEVLLSARLERDASGAPLRTLSVMQDVTLRRRAERALVEERQRLANLIEGAGAATWEWHVPSGAMRLNERWAEILGRSLGELAPLSIQTWRDHTHPDDLGRARQLMAQHLAGELDRFECEFRMRHRDGHWVWLLSRGAVMTRATDGTPEWMFGSHIDITGRKLQEEALRKSEEFLERKGRIAGVGGWEMDLATSRIQWSSEMYRIHGVAPSYQIVLEEAIEFYAPEARPVIKAAVEQAAAGGGDWDLELPFIRADGSRTWVRAVGTATFEDGRPVRLAGTLQDVTARVAEQLKLQEARERIALATDSGGIGIWDWDIVEDRMSWDGWMYRLYGCQPCEEAIAYEWWRQRIHPEDLAAAEQAVRDGIEDRRPFDTEFRIVWDDGSVRHLRASGRITRDATGRALRMVGTNWDITEQHRLVAELAARQNLLQVTLASIGDGVITTDADGHVAWLNPMAERLTGWPTLAASGLPLSDVFPLLDARSREPTADPLAACLMGGSAGSRDIDAVLVCRSGEEFAIEDQATPIRDDHGTILGAVLVFRDVSHRRRNEAERAGREHELRGANAELQRLAGDLRTARDAAEQGSRAKSRFLAGMSHELRTPLNGILGYAQLLRIEGGLNAVQATRLDAMLTAGAHLLEMINCVLDLSEIEAEHVELRPVGIDPLQVAGTCLDLVRVTAGAKGLALGTSIAPGTPRLLTTDPTRLRQVLLNLLGNAVKFSERGGVHLRLGPGPGGGVRIEVADTGPGIRNEQRQHLFQEFHRLDVGRADAIEGAGLGLAVSSRLMFLMGGRIGHADNPGGGSVFWLELPLTLAAPVNATVAVAAAAPDPPIAEPVRPLRVLVVDDVAMNREIAACFLRLGRHDVACAEGGVQAVAAVADGDFDVVLMDVRMPEVDGLEATRRIRALGGLRGLVPVIGLTAQAFAEQVADCRAAGMDGHLAKPYSPEALLAEVAHAAAAGQARRDGQDRDAAAIGSELPVLDQDVLGGMAAVLAPEVIAAHLQSLAENVQALRRALQQPGALTQTADALVEVAHAVAGSAGMFGFRRLAAVGLRFERAVRSGAADAAALADGLSAAAAATVHAIRCHTG